MCERLSWFGCSGTVYGNSVSMVMGEMYHLYKYVRVSRTDRTNAGII